MRPGIVGVNDVRAPGLDPLCDSTGCAEVPVGGGPDRGYRESGAPGPAEEGRVGRCDDQRFVTCVSLGSRDQPDLPLAAAPYLTHVDVQDSQ